MGVSEPRHFSGLLEVAREAGLQGEFEAVELRIPGGGDVRSEVELRGVVGRVFAEVEGDDAVRDERLDDLGQAVS